MNGGRRLKREARLNRRPFCWSPSLFTLSWPPNPLQQQRRDPRPPAASGRAGPSRPGTDGVAGMWADKARRGWREKKRTSGWMDGLVREEERDEMKRSVFEVSRQENFPMIRSAIFAPHRSGPVLYFRNHTHTHTSHHNLG